MNVRSSQEECSNSRENSESNHNIDVRYLPDVSQNECRDQVTHNLRAHIESPKVGKEESFSALSGTVRNILSLSRFSSALSKTIDN